MYRSTLPFDGLTTPEVKERISQGKSNKYVPAKIKTIPEILIENSFTVFNLVNSSLIGFMLYFYFNTSDERLLWDMLGITLVTVMNTVLAIYQEIKATRTLANMNLLKDKKVKVVRDGKQFEIDKHDVVVDDVILLEKGEQVIVDGEVLTSNHMEVDESLVTGESISIDKQEGDNLLSGTFCVYGNGYYRAVKVGDESYAADITHHAKKYKFVTSPLQKKINIIFVSFFIITILMVLIEGSISLFNGGLEVENVRKISTIAFSLIPEGLVFFATLTFMLGIYKIAKVGAVIQKLNAIDSFSTIHIVCMDKTGTLTQNKISVASVTSLNGYDDDTIKKLLATYGSLSSDTNATIKALDEYEMYDNYEMIDELPFRSETKMSAIRFKFNGSEETFLFGAYDVVMDKFKEEDKEKAQRLFEEKQLRGYRNLLFAKIDVNGGGLTPDAIKQAEAEPIAFVSMKDEARPDAMEAIELFNKHGVKVKIISGDSADSVQATLREVEWDLSDDDLITGKELEQLDKKEFEKAVLNKTVFVRLQPEQKLDIVKTLRKKHYQTAVVGDGVNDLPAIKESNLGIAMEEGSTISKEAADIVLLENKFTLLPQIFDEGNRIINTVIFVARLFLSKTTVIMVLSMLSWAMIMEYPLTPRNSALMSLLGVGFPAYVIATKNKNTVAIKKFFTDIIWFVGTTTVVFVGVSYLIDLFGNEMFGITDSAIGVIMVAVLIILFCVNYVVAVWHDDPKNKAAHLISGAAMIAVYVIFASFKLDFFPLNLVTKFYEITPIPFSQWKLIALFSAAGSVVLYLLHWVRIKLIDNFIHK